VVLGDVVDGAVVLHQGEALAVLRDRRLEPCLRERSGELDEPGVEVLRRDRVAQSLDLPFDAPAQEGQQAVPTVVGVEEVEHLRCEAVVAVGEQSPRRGRETVAGRRASPRAPDHPDHLGGDEALVGEHGEVPTGGHFGDLETGRELGDRGIPVAPQMLHDGRPLLTEQRHQRPRATSSGAGVRRRGSGAHAGGVLVSAAADRGRSLGSRPAGGGPGGR
jgi:hypothetical protein